MGATRGTGCKCDRGNEIDRVADCTRKPRETTRLFLFPDFGGRKGQIIIKTTVFTHRNLMHAILGKEGLIRREEGGTLFLIYNP